MKQFRFRLNSVLDYRQQVLESRQNEYAQALKKVRLQEERKADAERRYRELNQRFREEAAIGITAADALGYETGLRVLEDEIARETQLLAEYRKAAEEKRAAVLSAHQDTAVLERLKDKQMEAYRKAVQKSDERFIDELVSAARCGQSG